MSESGSRWEPDEQRASEPASEIGGPSEAVAPTPPESGQQTSSPGHGLFSRTGLALVAAGLALFLTGGAGGYYLAIARTSSTQIVPTGFRIEGGLRGDGDGGRGFGQSSPFGQTSPFGQSNPFGTTPQGTTT